MVLSGYCYRGIEANHVQTICSVHSPNNPQGKTAQYARGDTEIDTLDGRSRTCPKEVHVENQTPRALRRIIRNTLRREACAFVIIAGMLDGPGVGTDEVDPLH